MKYILFLFIIFKYTKAHMPAFPPTDTSSMETAYEIKDVTTKSWGIYGRTDKVHWFKLEGVKDEEMTISLNKNKDKGYYDLAIWGDGLNSRNCTPGWYGWTTDGTATDTTDSGSTAAATGGQVYRSPGKSWNRCIQNITKSECESLDSMLHVPETIVVKPATSDPNQPHGCLVVTAPATTLSLNQELDIGWNENPGISQQCEDKECICKTDPASDTFCELQAESCPAGKEETETRQQGTVDLRIDFGVCQSLAMMQDVSFSYTGYNQPYEDGSIPRGCIYDIGDGEYRYNYEYGSNDCSLSANYHCVVGVTHPNPSSAAARIAPHMINGVYMTRDLSELPEEVRTAIGDTEAFVLHGDAKEPVEYEPFGVGLYYPTGGCKDTFPSSSTYYMALIPGNGTDVGYSLGVGMEERFGLDELIIMPFLITRTFEWGGRSLAIIILIWVAAFLIAAAVKGYFFLTMRNEYNLLDRDGDVPVLHMTAYYLIWAGACGLIASAISFMFQVIWCATEMPSGSELGAGVWVAIVVHILIPLALGATMLIMVHIREILIDYRLAIWKNIGVMAAALYGLFLGWQAFAVFPILIFCGSLTHFILRYI